MPRGLFQRLQQRVEGLSRQHVDFVDHVDLVLRSTGANRDIRTQLANLLNSSVAGTVDFQHIHVIPGRYGAARVALITGCGRGSLDAVQRFGEDSGRRCLADSPRTGEQVGMAHTVCGDGVFQRPCHLGLSNQLIKQLWPVTPSHDLVARILGLVRGVTSHVCYGRQIGLKKTGTLGTVDEWPPHKSTPLRAAPVKA